MNDNALNNLTSAICALIEAIGMMEENKQRAPWGEAIVYGEAMAYGEAAFKQLIDKHNLTGF